MQVEIIAKTGNGHDSTPRQVDKTFKEVIEIAKHIRGDIVYGKGFSDGTRLVIEI